MGISKGDQLVSRNDKLTDRQRDLMERHVGLVGVHLRRFFPGLNHPRRDREWDDLFQEGCLGLARAASCYDAACGVPFPSYAFRRIRLAVGRAIPRAFATVRMPDGAAEDAGTVVSLECDPPARAADARHDLFAERAIETIGERVRAKYERAVREATDTVRDALNQRRSRVVERVADERFLVPDEDYRTHLRRIARDTNTPYSRVTGIERRLAELVRDRLSADGELDAMQVEARRSPDGMAAELDGGALSRVSDHLDAQISRSFDTWPAAQRARVLTRLLFCCDAEMNDLLQTLLPRLSIEQKSALLAESGP